VEEEVRLRLLLLLLLVVVVVLLLLLLLLLVVVVVLLLLLRFAAPAFATCCCSCCSSSCCSLSALSAPRARRCVILLDEMDRATDGLLTFLMNFFDQARDRRHAPPRRAVARPHRASPRHRALPAARRGSSPTGRATWWTRGAPSSS
jgi:hypothetical protein